MTEAFVVSSSMSVPFVIGCLTTQSYRRNGLSAIREDDYMREVSQHRLLPLSLLFDARGVSHCR